MKVAKKVAKKTVVKKKSVGKKVVKKKVVKKKRSQKKDAPKPVKKVAKKTAVKKRHRRGVSVSDAAREEQADEHGFVYINGRKIRLISSNGLAKKKRRSKVKTEGTTEIKVLSLKTNLSAKQLRVYRDRLLKYRARLLIDLDAIEKEALNLNADISHMPIHMADVGSDVYDQDLKLGMAASERKRIRDIEDALVRIKKKTYGVCHITGDKIPEARLQAKPWAKYTKESAEKIERQASKK
jgi:RNA polymerase-binding transcription factor DksA